MVHPQSVLIRASEKLRYALVPVPRDGQDVCPTCRSWRHERFPYCSNCMQAREELTSVCDRVIPISLYRRPSPLRDWLKYYKTASDYSRDEYLAFLSVIAARFWLEARRTIIDVVGRYSLVTIVPSSVRPGAHPFKSVLEASGASDCIRDDLLRRGPGPLGHRLMSDDAFLANYDLSGQRILLADDVFTTGARAQSAVSCLHSAGAQVVAILVLARRVDPHFNSAAMELWDRQSKIPYEFSDAVDWLETS
jgi:predicted amidophosphoribosyltransferase